MSKSKAPIERAGRTREDRDQSRDDVEASFIPQLKRRGALVPDRIGYDARAGFAPAADGAPSPDKYQGNVQLHRDRNQPAGGHVDERVPFANLKSGRE